MTSKEALDLIATNCAMNCKKAYHEKCSENCEVLKAFKMVKKDLEVLELVKKYFEFGCAFYNSKKSIHINERQHNHNTIYGINISNEEYNLIKESLEND